MKYKEGVILTVIKFIEDIVFAIRRHCVRWLCLGVFCAVAVTVIFAPKLEELAVTWDDFETEELPTA